MTEAFTDLNTATGRTLGSGIEITPVTGESLQVVRTRIPSGDWSFPAHSHPHEQFAIVLEGEVEFTIDGAGTQTLGPGGVFYFAPNQRHGVRVLSKDSGAVLLECYTPPRRDYSGEIADPDPANPQ